MPFDLVAIGGSGQCILLELLFRRERNPESPLPQQVWIVDPDDGKGKGDEHLSSCLGKAAENAKISLQWIWPLQAGRTLQDVLGNTSHVPYGAQGFFNAALTVTEKTQLAEKGFFAMPRIAGAWVGLCGFQPGLPFADPEYTGSAGTLAVVGSLAGGTGAGLLSSILSAVREPAPTSWKRNLLVVPMLPWFNSALGGGPAWEDCCWNAHDGLLELQRLAANFNARIAATNAAPAQIAHTFMSVIGTLEDPATTAPPSLAEAWKARSFGGGLAEIADVFVNLVQHTRPSTINSHPTRVVVGVGELPKRSLEGYSGGAYRNGFVSEQLAVLGSEIRRVRNQNLFGIPSHLGDFIDAVISAARKPKGEPTDFWDRFDGALAARADTLRAGAESVSRARDPTGTGKIVDAGCKSSSGRAKALADSKGLPDAGPLVADMIVNCLLAAAEDQAIKSLRGATDTQPLLPNRLQQALNDTKVQPESLEGLVSLKSYGLAGPKVLAEAIRPGVAKFHGASWARLLGHCHKYDGFSAINESRNVENPLGQALLLWKGVLLGLLEFKNYLITNEDRNKSSWFKAEDFDRDVGTTLTTVVYDDQVIGLLTAKNGFIPCAEIVDDKGKTSPAVTTRDKLLDAVREEESALDRPDLLELLLEAFALHSTNGMRGDMPWQQLLQPITTSIGGLDPRKLLNQFTVPARRIELQTQDGNRQFRLPLVVGNKDKLLRKVVFSPHADKLLTVAAGNTLLLAKPGEVRLGTIEIEGNHRHLLTLDRAGWETAGKRVVAGTPSGVPWLQIDW